MKTLFTKKICLIVSLILLWGPGASLASALPIINVDFNGSRFNTSSPTPPVTYVGQAALAAPGDVWNGLYLPNLSPTPNSVGTGGGTFNNLLDSTGALTSVGITVDNTYSQNVPGSTNNSLLDDYLFVSDYPAFTPITNANVTLTGLNPGKSYSLYVYGGGSIFTVDNISQTTTAGGPDFTLGQDYVVFNGLADSTGDITVNFAISGAAGIAGEFGSIAGLQLQQQAPASVPEPSTWALLLGGLALLFAFQQQRQDRKTS